MRKEHLLKEAAERLKDGEFSIRKLAETAGVSEETARQYAKREGYRPGSARGLFRIGNGETPPEENPEAGPGPEAEPQAEQISQIPVTQPQKTKPQAEIPEPPEEIRADLFVAAYMRGFDAGYQRGFDSGVKTGAKTTN